MARSSASGQVALFTALAALLSGAGIGCRASGPPAPFNVLIKIESDPGRPVGGAAVVFGGSKVLATSTPDGRAMLALKGSEGEVVDVAIRCPENLQSPVKPLSIRLTRLADKSRIPEYAIACPPSVRRVVVGVRADNGPNLPVVVLNRVVARTDLSGAAHFALDVAPGAQFSVTLDTTERGNERLKPPSPTRPFTAGPRDDIVVFEQRFDLEKKAPIFVPKPSLPINVSPDATPKH